MYYIQMRRVTPSLPLSKTNSTQETEERKIETKNAYIKYDVLHHRVMK